MLFFENKKSNAIALLLRKKLPLVMLFFENKKSNDPRVLLINVSIQKLQSR